MIATAPPDNDQRRLAAAELDRNLVVLAGAGTGKTKLLIDRLTLLIVGKEIPIEKIVALTFTKKAAEEMRVRLEDQLRLIIDGKIVIEPLVERFASNRTKWPALAQKALDDIPKSQIGTIHSFAGHLLRLYPLQAGVDPAFREDEGMITETVFESMWEKWIAVELGTEAPRAKTWLPLLQRVELSELQAIAWALVNPMVADDSLKEKVDLKEPAKRALEALKAIESKHDKPSRAPKFLPALEALRSVLSSVSSGKKVPSDLVDLIDGVDSVPKGWDDAEEALTELRKTAEAFGRVDDALLRDVFALVLPFVRSVRAELARVGAVSFDGLLVFARNLLRDHGDVRESLKKRFAAFLVDEFQDTDPLQGEILFYLAEKTGGNARRWQDVKLEAGRLFVVGDPKQSIYHFRGADIAAFEAFEEHILAQPGAVKARLSANFRSDARILDFVNAIFPAAMAEKKYVQPAYAALQPGKETDGASAAVTIVRVAGEGDAKFKAEDRRMTEASVIADWIQARAKEGLPYSSVALLLRSANAFEEYLEAFRRRGIRYLAEGEKTFYRTSEVIDFLNLLSAVADPKDTLALAGVLRSPAGGLTDKEIWELNREGGLSYTREPRVHADKIGRLFRILRDLSRAADSQPLDRTIQDVLTHTWILETASASAQGEQAVANIIKVGRLAEEWSRQSPMTLKDFVQRFERYRDDARDEGENPLADVKYDAVKVLTIHKAKGLEFPVVILPNLSAAKRGGADKTVLRRDWRSGLTGIRLEKSGTTNGAMAVIELSEAERELAEEVRVFYVAATRAKNELVCFVGSGDGDKGRFASIVKAAGALPNVTIEDIRQNPDFKTDFDKPLLSLGAAWNAVELADRINRRNAALSYSNNQKLILSPTSLLSEPEKLRVFDEEAAALARERAIDIGHVCHKVLEDWDFAAGKSKFKGTLAAAVERAGRLYELDPSDATDAGTLAECEAIIKGFLESPSYEKIRSAKIVGREIPFVYPRTGGDGTAMRGYIDLMYETGGKLVVADYKTNKTDEKTRKNTVDHYRPQATAYREAVSKALGKDAAFELIFLRDGLSVVVE